MNGHGPLGPRIVAALLQRCSRCYRGPAYEGFITMHEHCPACGWRYEREPGYFVGAMYASYTLGFAIVMPIWFILMASGASFGTIMAVVLGTLAVTSPIMFRYSRVLWMHFDAYFNGTSEDAETAG